tara:strand:+ start:593 stop:727 length:135 start_codon:yes stop_codon:yes gene_type:complete
MIGLLFLELKVIRLFKKKPKTPPITNDILLEFEKLIKNKTLNNL